METNTPDTFLKTLLLSQDENDIDIAADILKRGGLVAFPTETVYGLGGNALSPDSSRRIYEAKGRPSDNPLIVHIADKNSVYELAKEVPEETVMLMEAFWPGPLTIILPKKPEVPDETTGGLDTVAIRMPSHPAALALIQKSGVYIAAPSANTSGRPSPTLAEHVVDDLNGRIDAIIDGGPVGIGIESTIVDLTGCTESAKAAGKAHPPTILRPGYITIKMLEQIIGETAIDPTILRPAPGIRPKAPGMKYTHYAPKGKLIIIEDKETPDKVTDAVVDYINNCNREEILRISEGGQTNLPEQADKQDGQTDLPAQTDKQDEGKNILSNNQSERIVVLTTNDMVPHYTREHIITLGDDGSGATVAARLYAALRECDKIEADYILSESFNRDELGGAVMNRLLKAAGHHVVHV